MKSTAHVGGHPIHPMLIPYPFALLSSGVAFDVAARLTRHDTWSDTARHLTLAGLGSALVAAVPGVIDYFGSVPAGTPIRRRATTHALCNLSALTCFAAAQTWRAPDGMLPGRAIAISLIGTALLSLGGWFGGELVYHDHVGVDDETGTKALPATEHTASHVVRLPSPR